MYNNRYRPLSASSTNFYKRPSLTKTNNLKKSYNNFGKKTSTFFIQEKETGDPYFRKTRVGSCRKVVVKNGIPFALTFRVKNPRGEPLNHYKYTCRSLPKNSTTYQDDYCSKKVDYHLGMENKPLVKYNPNHPRSKLPEDLEFKTFRNISLFDIGNEGLINRKQWISTYKDSYRPISVYRISNQGILSDLAKRTHYKFSNIEYK